MTTQSGTFAPSPGAAPLGSMVLAQARMEARLMLRNGEQVLLAVVIPLIVLAGGLAGIDRLGLEFRHRPIDVLTPGVLALAVMSTAFTSLAIATGFERRYGVIKRLGSSPLPRHGLLLGKVSALLLIEALQVVVISSVALALGSLAAVWSLAGWVGRSRNHAARIQAVTVLGDTPTGAPVEVICAMPPSWRGHRAGQFVFVRFDAAEGAHPFTIASAPNALGHSPDGEPLLRLVIKPLGDYTRTLHRRLHAGQRVDIEGPYGRFDGQGSRRRQQVWVAAGVGVTPFFALLEARQPGMPTEGRDPAPVHMHYCTRDARRDPLLARLQALCAQAQPPVPLTVHNEAEGQRLTPKDLQAEPGPLDIWFCGPQGLGDALHAHPRGPRPWRRHREYFCMR